MKNIKIIILAILTLLLTACEKDEDKPQDTIVFGNVWNYNREFYQDGAVYVVMNPSDDTILTERTDQNGYYEIRFEYAESDPDLYIIAQMTLIYNDTLQYVYSSYPLFFKYSYYNINMIGKISEVNLVCK